jgi:ABC-2 type transport system permease protein
LPALLIIIFSQFGGTTVRFMLEWKVLGSLMDLLGTSIVAEMEGWTPIDKNTRLVLLEGTWLWNRIAWFGMAAGRLRLLTSGFAWPRYAWRTKVGFFHRRDPGASGCADRHGMHLIHCPYPIPPFRSTCRTLRVILYSPRMRARHLPLQGTSFRTIAGSRGGLTLVAVLAIGTGLFATEYMEWLGVPLFARTEEVLRILTPPLSSYQTQWIIIPLLTIFYAGELVWREREAGLNELSDTTPVPEWVMFLGKFMGLALIITTWVAFLMMAGIINQLVMDYHHFEIGVYMKALFGIQLTNYLLFALLVLWYMYW